MAEKVLVSYADIMFTVVLDDNGSMTSEAQEYILSVLGFQKRNTDEAIRELTQDYILHPMAETAQFLQNLREQKQTLENEIRVVTENKPMPKSVKRSTLS